MFLGESRIGGLACPFGKECPEAQAEQILPQQSVTSCLGGKSSITFVTEFGGAESYRFFFGTGTDLPYELDILPAVGCSGGTADGFERGRVCGDVGAVIGRRLGGWRWSIAGASG
jgi:hypothetical protein